MTTYLRSQPCIPTESGAFVPPSEALVCNNSAVRQLISPEQLQQLLGKQFVHTDITALHTCAELRALLGVGEFSPLQVVQLIEQMSAEGSLQQQGVQWVQRMLLCLFGMLETGSGSAAGGCPDQAGQLGRARVLQKLRKLQILPLQAGSFAALEPKKSTTADDAASRAVKPPTSSVQRSRQSAAGIMPVFFPLQEITGTAEQQATISPSPGKRPTAAAAASPGCAGAAAVDVSLRQLLDTAGIRLEWLSGLQLLDSDLFSGLSSDELELLHTGLLVSHCVCRAGGLSVLCHRNLLVAAVLVWPCCCIAVLLCFMPIKLLLCLLVDTHTSSHIAVL